MNLRNRLSRLVNRYQFTWKIARRWSALQVDHPWLIWGKEEREYIRRIKS